MKVITDTLDISRSNQYDGKKGRGRFGIKKKDDDYLRLIKEITDSRPTFGYRRVTAVINRILVEKQQKRINHKRIYRIMRTNHLLLQKHTGRPVRAHTGDIITLASNMRWCSDIFEILCWNGQKVRTAFAMDCCDREIMGYVTTTGGITGNMVRDLIASCMEYRFEKADSIPRSYRVAIGQRQRIYGERDHLLCQAHGVQALHDPVLQPGVEWYSGILRQDV